MLKALGGAVATFRERLGESLASVQRYDAKIEEATTPSLEALKAYSQGVRTRRPTGDFDSVPFFRRAIELDPEFALAYARLGTVYSNLGQADEARKMTTRAFELRDKVSEAERLYIEARYYTTVEPDVQKAIELPADAGDLSRTTTPRSPTRRCCSSSTATRPRRSRNLEHAVRVAPDQPLGWSEPRRHLRAAASVSTTRESGRVGLKVQDSSSARGSSVFDRHRHRRSALADTRWRRCAGRRDEVDFLTVRAGRGPTRDA